MWNKIYLAVFAVALVVMGFFTFYAISWLGSIGDPKHAFVGYEYYASLAWTFLWLSTIILLILANLLLWQTRRAWAMWASFGFFAVFILLRYFWLEPAFFSFQKLNKFTDSSFSLSPFFGVLLVIVAGIIVFFNQYLNLRLNEKMHPSKDIEGESEVVEEES